MPYHTGNVSIHGSTARNLLISQSSILDSALDMNHRNITTVKCPIRPLDAANKGYVDDSVTKASETFETHFSGTTVTLVGIEYANIGNVKGGSYIATVTPYEDGPTACFAISKMKESQIGQFVRLTAHPGAFTNEQLEFSWPRNGLLKLKKTGLNYDGQYLVNFNVKNFSSVSAPPALPDDTATKDYVDAQLREQLDIKFGGTLVVLTGTTEMRVINQRFGSYVITVSPVNIEGAPTATFSVSKTSLATDGVVKVITQCQGQFTPEELVLSWPTNGVIMLKKTGPGYDGTYIVDMGLKNFSSVPLPSLPTDTATLAYVDRQIERKMQAKFGGELVHLEEDKYKRLFHMRPGAYIICVSSVAPNGPCATFSISKSSNCVEPHIIVLSSSPGRDTNERLQIAWPRDSMILVRKTGLFYDGDYIADVPSKNLSAASETILDSDIADKDYVDSVMRQFMDVKHGGVQVELTDTHSANVAALRTGSYLVNVSAPHIDGAPTSSFIVCKSKMSLPGSVVRLTGCPGYETNETIVLTWPPNSRLKVRKTGCHYDGAYFVDFNLKNFTATQEPVIPTDLATRSYVDGKILEKMNVEFGGVLVQLMGTASTPVIAQRNGSYFVSVNPTFDGGPTAAFQVSKSSVTEAAQITELGWSPGALGTSTSTSTRVHLTWPANEKLQIYKDGTDHDGSYIVDMNLKNFSSVSPPVFPSDTVDKAYVDQIFGALTGSITEAKPFMKTFTLTGEPIDLGSLPSGLYTGLVFSEPDPISFSWAKLPQHEIQKDVANLQFHWAVNDHVYVTGEPSNLSWIIKFT